MVDGSTNFSFVAEQERLLQMYKARLDNVKRLQKSNANKQSSGMVPIEVRADLAITHTYGFENPGTLCYLGSGNDYF